MSVSGNQLWAEKFDRHIGELFALQVQLVRSIVSTLVGRVQAAAVQRANRKPLTNLLAYVCYLKGNALRCDVAVEPMQARHFFEQAIALDPDYGLALDGFLACRRMVVPSAR